MRQEAWLHHQQHSEAQQHHMECVLEPEHPEVRGRHDQALLPVTNALDLELEVRLRRFQACPEGAELQVHQGGHLGELALGVADGLRAPSREERDVLRGLAEELLLQVLLEDVGEGLWLGDAGVGLAAGVDQLGHVLRCREDHLDDLPGYTTAKADGGDHGDLSATLLAERLAEHLHFQDFLTCRKLLGQARQGRGALYGRIRRRGDLGDGLSAVEGAAQLHRGREQRALRRPRRRLGRREAPGGWRRHAAGGRRRGEAGAVPRESDPAPAARQQRSPHIRDVRSPLPARSAHLWAARRARDAMRAVLGPATP
mmetsp:Transcript_132468/g.424026  ORF Transcript_132468/g.424026 Transcript_132468/m.424026 type:complete len:313 (-) Transcript_132468:12-950(-)